MGMTISEKILAKAAHKKFVKAGEIVWVKVDQAMMDDILGPRIEIAEKMDNLKGHIWNPEKVTIISDHYTPPANVKQAEIVAFTRRWAKEHHVDHYYEYEGPCHQVMIEKGRIKPGEVAVGTDSHTCTYGAIGAFATGIGSTEMLGVVTTGEIWLKVPPTLKFIIDGQLPHGVMAKDLILKIIGQIGHNGATYKAMEFAGKTIESMIMDERLCITNMAVEAGAKNGIIASDKVTQDFLKNLAIQDMGTAFKTDEDAVIEQSYRFNANEIEPMCACPHEVDNVKEVKKLEDVKIDQAYVGSCTGGRYHDLKVAAKLLKGHQVAKGVRLLVSPASKAVYARCLKDGILNDLADAGAMILPATCGACLGVHSGIIGSGEVCVSSTNRNFIGRMGSKESQLYLASPLSVAASAITGRITDPREFMEVNDHE